MSITVGGGPPEYDDGLPGGVSGLYGSGSWPASGTKAQRRVLALAVGVLVGLQRRRWQDAAVELIGVAHDHEMSPYVLAEALVELSGGQSLRLTGGSRPDTVRIARKQWGHLLDPVEAGADDPDPDHVLVW
ncbi:hypothetical protein EB75_17045 [Mycobacterium sp. ST-F2]|uniref:hypothetical protein n=1 Tax=Mycobacterium sp. ST-F2 TaxID=1490484 RepID=UPI00095BE2F7|nr:hypothetical protein [Mycobacterium sp. ST-F2]OKH81342.1 hypothetical protein EB75_17045 [Mycobacterium sp. ST-F2]